MLLATASSWLTGFLSSGSSSDPTWLYNLNDNFSLGNVGTIIVTALAIAIPLVLSWFAFRWVYRKVRGAFKRGN